VNTAILPTTMETTPVMSMDQQLQYTGPINLKAGTMYQDTSSLTGINGVSYD
jgi:hypothetical protein